MACALVGEQSGDGHFHQGEHPAVAHHANAALALPERVHGQAHVGLVLAGDDEVVGVVPDRTGDSTARQSKILQQPVTDSAILPVPFHHGQETPFRMGRQRGGPVGGGCEGHLLVEGQNARQGHS